MARSIRVEFPGAFYHVMARGNRRFISQIGNDHLASSQWQRGSVNPRFRAAAVLMNAEDEIRNLSPIFPIANQRANLS